MDAILKQGETYEIKVVAGMYDGITCFGVFNDKEQKFETAHFDVSLDKCYVINLGDKDVIYTCNGCGKPLAYENIAYQNTDNGDDYCSDCNEAIQGDPESAAGLKDEEPFHHGKAIYKGEEFPDSIGETVDVYDDHSNPDAPCYQIKFPGSSEYIGNMDDEDLDWLTSTADPDGTLFPNYQPKQQPVATPEPDEEIKPTDRVCRKSGVGGAGTVVVVNKYHKAVVRWDEKASNNQQHSTIDLKSLKLWKQ